MIQWPARSSDRPDPVTGHPEMVIIFGWKDGTIGGSGSRWATPIKQELHEIEE